ncbi:prion-inhibition and propagation-domain-containing protein [Chaetomium fimeti]|uniref:Prion-inhibition and propagation-domain-containing protein n=1 Tax=Chaetomium fimeti TaxID=1854472 RepID=A0AAE0HD13_9PEZI|nr:prion-inhibition and propagation-domain-containing protein [Chaetomium fimeti]
MEPVGLAVGIAGLAGLFTTCIECFNIVQQGRYFGRDYWILEAKYANQRLRLQTWGRACGFTDANNRTNLPWNDDVRLAVEATLQRMAGLFQDHRTLYTRYGLSLAESESGKTSASAILGAFASKLQARASSLVKAHTDAALPWSSSPRRPALPTAIRWAVDDKRKFADLVQHLKDFNDDLEALTSELNVRHRQRDLIREEVGSIIDVEELETIETARMGISDPVADAASLRLCQIQEGGQRPANTPGRDESISTEVPVGTPSVSPADAAWEVLDQPVPLANMDSRESVPYQVLHRVVCDSQPVTIFFDEPNYQTTSGPNHQWLVIDECNPLHNPTTLHLSGKRALPSLGPYLEQNSHLAFVLFKEYTCCHDNITTRTAASTESGIYLMSDALCSTLKSLDLKADPPTFCPTMELRSPYEWYFHNKALLDKTRPLKPSPGKDAHAVRGTETLLDCIQSCMAHIYDPIEHSGVVRWESLPLVFPPGGMVIERNSEGDDDDRAFVQVGPVQFTRTTDEEKAEVLEINVTGRLHSLTSQPLLSEPHLHEVRKLHIPRSHFHKSGQEARMYKLPICPAGWAGDDVRGYLVDRGQKYWKLGRGTHLVTDESESVSGFADGLDQYIVDAAEYEHLQRPRFTDLTERVPHLDLFSEEEEQLQDWQLIIYTDREEMMRAEYEEQEEERAMELGEEFGSMSTERARFFACQPHVIYGFHLRHHTSKKLLVRHVRRVPDQEWGPSQDMVVGESEKAFLERLLAPGEPGPYPTRPQHLRTSPRVVMTVRGRAGREAIEAVSIMARRSLYRVQIVTESEAGQAERTLQQAGMLASEWGCIVVIEDVLGAYYLRNRPRESVDAAVATLLRFLDAFDGIVILSLPDEDVRLDLRIEQRVCASFNFVRPACRRVLWRQYIKKWTDHNFRLKDLSPEDEKYIDKLARFELSWDAIRSLVDAVVRTAFYSEREERIIDWDLLIEMAEKMAARSSPSSRARVMELKRVDPVVPSAMGS